MSLQVACNGLCLELAIPKLPIIGASEEDSFVIIVSGHFDLFLYNDSKVDRWIEGADDCASLLG